MARAQERLFYALEQWLDDGPGIKERMRKALMDSSTVLPLYKQGGRIRGQIGWIVPFLPISLWIRYNQQCWQAS